MRLRHFEPMAFVVCNRDTGAPKRRVLRSSECRPSVDRGTAREGAGRGGAGRARGGAAPSGGAGRWALALLGWCLVLGRVLFLVAHAVVEPAEQAAVVLGGLTA
jgi:hypothetical protein